MKKVSKAEAIEAARKTGSYFGKKNSKEHMTNISRNYWNSPAGKKRKKDMSKHPIKSRIIN